VRSNFCRSSCGANALRLYGWTKKRSLDPAIVEITKKTALKIAIESLERSKHRRVTSVTFAIEEKAVPQSR
jgi:hypothetical protein